MVAVAAEGPIRADAVPAAAGAGAERADAAAAGGVAAAKAREDEVREYKSDVLNPSAEEFVPLSRRQQGGGGARRLSADAPVFVSPAIDYYAPPSTDSVRAGGQFPSAATFSTVSPT